MEHNNTVLNCKHSISSSWTGYKKGLENLYWAPPTHELLTSGINWASIFLYWHQTARSIAKF